MAAALCCPYWRLLHLQHLLHNLVVVAAAWAQALGRRALAEGCCRRLGQRWRGRSEQLQRTDHCA
eukprot:7379089-Prymnesium_polylepis.1